MDRIADFYKNIPKEYKYLALIVIATFITRIIYVFLFTEYQHYLVSDMGAYWQRAHERFNGKIFSINQWTGQATFFHFYLAFVFKVLEFFNLFKQRLEIILLLNITYTSFSIVFFYLIAKQILSSYKLSLLVSLLFAFSFHSIYFNTFILSESVAIPLLIFSTYLLFISRENKILLTLCGISLGIAVGIKPAISLISIAFSLYIVFSLKPAQKSLYSACIFLLSFLLIIFLILSENYHISKGRLKSLSNHSAVTFFIGQCKIANFVSESKEYTIKLGRLKYLLFPELPKLESYHTDIPIHNKKHFYKMGLECIRNDPSTLIDDLLELRFAFWGPPFPHYPYLLGYNSIRKLSCLLLAIMTVSLGLIYFMRKDKKIFTNKVAILLSIPMLMAITNFIFVSGGRHFSPAHFAIYLLSFLVLSRIKEYKKQAENYLFVILIIILIYMFGKFT